MKLSRNLILSAEILLAHKLRTFLSLTGMVVGVGAVILMVAIGRGTQKRILDQIRQMGTNLIMVHAGQTPIIAGRMRQLTTVKTLVPSDAQAIAEECPSVARTAPVAGKKVSCHYEGNHTTTQVIGTTALFFSIRNWTLASGRGFTPEEYRACRRVAILGPTTAKRLFETNLPEGAFIQIGRVPFEVIGFTSSKGVDLHSVDQDDAIIIPLTTALRRVFNVTHLQSILVQVNHESMMARAEQEITALLRQRHRLAGSYVTSRPAPGPTTAGKSDDFTIQNQHTLIETQRETSRDLTLLISAVATVSLLAGGIGILAVMMISVRERTREIGLRRALGARRRDIRTQFLMESVFLAGGGGLAGLLAGVGLAWLASALGYWDTLVSWPAAGTGLVFSVTLGIAFGLYPALRAARLEPIVALKAE